MPNEFYCSSCGQKLTWIRSAIPGKGKIVDLIQPHKCPGYAVKAKKDEQETVLDIIEKLKDLSPAKPAVEIEGPNTGRITTSESHFNLQDRRKEIIKSSAPAGLINAMKDIPTSGGDLDE